MTKGHALTILQALAKNKRVSKNSLAYKAAFEAISVPGIPVICGANTGTGSYSSSKSWLARTISILDMVGVGYVKENIAPSNGAWGDRITVNF